MANTFKAYTKSAVGTSTSTAYEVELGGASTKTAIIIGIALSNIHSSPINVNVQIDRPATGTTAAPSDDVYLAKNIPIPSGSTLEVMAGQKLILEYNGTASAGDKIVVTSDTASSLDVIVNALEITS
jgi:hypothetical protein